MVSKYRDILEPPPTQSAPSTPAKAVRNSPHAQGQQEGKEFNLEFRILVFGGLGICGTTVHILHSRKSIIQESIFFQI